MSENETMPVDNQYDPGLDEFYSAAVDSTQVDEANRFRTAPTGLYNVRLHKADPIRNSDKPERWDHDRWVVNCSADLYAMRDGDVEPRRMGRVFFDISPEGTWRDERTGELVKPARLWGQAVKALIKMGVVAGDPETGKLGNGVNNGEVVEALKQTPISMYVTETFVFGEYPNASYETYRSDEERAALVSRGGTPKNYVQSISMYRDEG